MIDPAPITAWLVLVVAILAVTSGIAAFIAFGWRWVGMPQIKAAISGALADSERDHRAEHASLEQRIDAETQARSASLSKAHDRIDRLLAPHTP